MKLIKIHAPFLKETKRVVRHDRRNKSRARQISEYGHIIKSGIQRIGCSYGIFKKKSEEIRVCADFSAELNAALKDYHYPLPSPEVFNKLNEGKVFSKRGLPLDSSRRK